MKIWLKDPEEIKFGAIVGPDGEEHERHAPVSVGYRLAIQPENDEELLRAETLQAQLRVIGIDTMPVIKTDTCRLARFYIHLDDKILPFHVSMRVPLEPNTTSQPSDSSVGGQGPPTAQPPKYNEGDKAWARKWLDEDARARKWLKQDEQPSDSPAVNS